MSLDNEQYKEAETFDSSSCLIEKKEKLQKLELEMNHVRAFIIFFYSFIDFIINFILLFFLLIFLYYIILYFSNINIFFIFKY